MAWLENCRFFVRSVAQQVQGGQCFRDLHDHVVHQIGIGGDVGKLRLFVEQARTDHDRQEHFADFVFSRFEPGRFAQEHAFHEADAPAAQIGVVRIVAQVQLARQLELFVAGQLTSDMGLEGQQRRFDRMALGVVGVVRFLSEQGIDPLAIGHHVGADRQGSQIAMRGYVIQRFFVQLVGVEEDLQAGELLSEGHWMTTLGIYDGEF